MLNSGTQGSEPLEVYQEKTVRIRQTNFELQPGGLYKKIKIIPTKTITIWR